MNRKASKQNSLGKMVVKMMSSELCHQHNSNFTAINLSDITFGCQQCKNSNDQFVSLEQIIDNPLLIMLRDLKLIKKYSFFQESIAKVAKIRQGFEALISDLQNKINRYCEEYQRNIEQACQHITTIIQSQKQTINNIQMQYRHQFELLISGNLANNSKEELRMTIQQFKSENEDPSEVINEKFMSLLNSLEHTPQINWQYLEHLYTTVTDPILWKKQKIMNDQQNLKQSYFNDLIPGIENSLHDQKYRLYYDSSHIALKTIQNANDSLDCTAREAYTDNLINQLEESHDDYYQLDQYRILGVSYHKLTLFSYAYDRLTKLQQYEISGCRQILCFSDCLILIANSRLIRLWLEDGGQDILGMGFSNLEYIPNNLNLVKCKDSKGDQYIRSVKHNLTNMQVDS